MVKILIGFDYELFLGQNFCGHEETLIKPTSDLMKLLSEKGVSATFFADVCCAMQHKKLGLNSFVNDFNSQMRYANTHGFDVQLHIHPNWLESTYSNGQWNISVEKYRLHRFGFDDGEMSAGAIIKAGVDYLNDLLLPTDPNYRCVAYRAGGYSIQPHSEIVTELRKNGIVIDSSVCGHQYANTGANLYDFRKLPRRMNWYLTPGKDFDYEGDVSEGGVFEVPMCSDRNTYWKRLMLPREKSMIRSVPLKGTYVKTDTAGHPRKQSRFQFILNYCNTYSLVSFDSMAYVRMAKFMEHIYRKYRADQKNIYISVICHPKISNEYVIDNMGKFIDVIKRQSDKFELISFRELYHELGL